MKAYLILTAVGPDRTGIVDDLSDYLASRDMNIESSRMAVLGGEFAIILQASGEDEAVDKVVSSPDELGRKTGLQVSLKKSTARAQGPVEDLLPYRITASGMDHQGIVHEVSSLLHSFNINIESMDTSIERAPVSGTPIFSMEALLSVPAGIKPRELKEGLDRLSDEHNVDIEFEPER